MVVNPGIERCVSVTVPCEPIRIPFTPATDTTPPLVTASEPGPSSPTYIPEGSAPDSVHIDPAPSTRAEPDRRAKRAANVGIPTGDVDLAACGDVEIADTVGADREQFADRPL